MTAEGHWVVVPAAGSGQRMEADRPKQYLQIGGRTILDYTLEALLEHPLICGVVLVLAEGDTYWSESTYSFESRVVTVIGGELRAESVRNGLAHLLKNIDLDQQVLVHDAARPCICKNDLDRIIVAGEVGAAGAVLGARVKDSMKLADDADKIIRSVARQSLWHAFTPQVFPLRKLHEAIGWCLKEKLDITDEASAIQQVGGEPKMVIGSPHNIKVTVQEDLMLAKYILAAQGRLRQ